MNPNNELEESFPQSPVQGYLISTDSSKLDIDMIHQYLSETSYWAKNIPLAVVKRSIANSFCF